MGKEEVDLKKNILVPEHRVLSKKEEKKILESLDINKEQLPKIQVNDLGLKGLDAEVGDIIEIKRRSPTAGRTKYYRVVVPAVE